MMATLRNDRPSQGSIEDLIEGLLDRGYNSTVGRVIDSVSSSTNSGIIAQRRDELLAEAERLAEAGERMTSSNPVLRALLADLDSEMRTAQITLAEIAPELEASGINASRVLTRQLSLPGMTDAQLNDIGIVWNQPDPEAVANLVSLVDSPEFAAELARFGDDVISTVANQAIRGQVFGWGPLRTARAITDILDTFPAARANTLMRTLQLNAYREGTAVHQNANRDIINRIIRIEVLDSRICLACIDLHGLVVWDRERDGGTPITRIDEHYNGRGTTIAETVVIAVDIQRGEDWFNELPDERRLELAGAANFNALEAGAVTLSDFVHETVDPLFGNMINEDSLVGILGNAAEQYYARNQ